MTWKMESSIGGALAPGSGFKYRLIIVMPFENCSEDIHSSEIMESKTEILYVLTDILPRTVQRIKVVQVRKGAKELGGATHLVTNYKAAFPRAFHSKLLDHWTVTGLDVPHDFLVDVKGVLRRLLKEGRVRDCANICSAG
jgi:hypothetical protein